MRATTLALYILPFATAAVVGFALFVVGAPRPFTGARLYGGSTDGVTRLSFRLAVADSYRGVEAPAEGGRVEVTAELAGGRRLAWSGELDALGSASVLFDVPGEPVSAPVSLRVVKDGRVLAEGRVWLSRDDWLSRANRRGGWYPVKSKGELAIRVAPERGAFAVPFAEALWVEVTRDGKPAAGALVHIESEGLQSLAKDEAIAVDAQGRLRLVVSPREHAVALRVVAEHEGARGEWYASLPIVPGAYAAILQHGALRIESPVLRERAYYALLSEHARLAGGAVRLDPDGRGGSVQLVELPRLPEGPLWAVVSSDPELSSDSTVGWPLRWPKSPHGDPPLTFEAPDRLLLDGMPLGERAETERRGSARAIAAGFTLLALLLASVIVVTRARRADVQLRAHLAAAGEGEESRDRIAEGRGGRVITLAVVCIALGFAVIALVALYRLS